MHIAKVGVVGAGTMGTGIAALAASTGVRVVLLDLPGTPDRGGVAREALAKALKSRPAPFMDPTRASLIETGNTEDDLDRLRDCDWIVEAIIEQAGPKQALFARLESIARGNAIISSNTSGIPMHLLAEGRSDVPLALPWHALLQPCATSTCWIDPRLTPPRGRTAMRGLPSTLGKGVVIAKDVPGFIANRLGLYGVVRTLRLMEQFNLTIDEVGAHWPADRASEIGHVPHRRHFGIDVLARGNRHGRGYGRGLLAPRLGSSVGRRAAPRRKDGRGIL
jgi:3-hydroxyacyl-CoA dehydrogenase